MSELTITKTGKPGTLPDENALGFGTHFTDHMFEMDYNVQQGWHNPRIVPYHQFDVDPANTTLHYGQGVFEGMKAFRTEDSRIVLFRTLEHLNRLNRSADILCIPQFDVGVVHNALRKLVELEKNWVPTKPGTSLYIRPFIFATDPYLGLRVAETYKMAIILSPVGAYYSAGFNPVKIRVEDKYVRAVPGGLGEAKTLANYAASLRAAVDAKKVGYAQTLWLDGIERKYIEEVGAMNIFFKINGELITPALTGSILSGITRKSVLEIARDWGLKATERRITIDEVYAAHSRGQLEEVFGSGTAAVISPVGELSWKDNKITINQGRTGELAQKLYDYVTGLQYGAAADKFGWVEEVSKA